MININLLPRRQSVSINWLIFMIISFFIIISLHKRCQTTLLEKQHKINLLKKEIQAINAEISNSQQKQQLALRSNTRRIDLPILLKKLSHAMPIGLYLIELSMIKNNLKLIGHAEKTSLISDWVTTLTANHFKVSLQEITANKSTDDFAVKFSLMVALGK